MPTNIIDKEIEKFDKRFNKTLWTVTDVKESDLGEYKTWLESTRDFHSTSLLTVREETIKEVLAEIQEFKHEDYNGLLLTPSVQARISGFNSALLVLENSLQSKLSKE